MKQCLAMIRNQKYDVYTFKGSTDWRFIPLIQLFSPYIRKGELIDWFHNENRTVNGNEFITIYKEPNYIEIYDISDRMSDETISELDPLKRFEMSKKNFAEILYQWEELRLSRPDIILVVIHEDNHVSLETDPMIIKEYQDAGYAFDINK